jgi:hypothetical protein
MAAIRKAAKTASRRRDPDAELEKADIDSCGKSRVLLAGLAGELHRRNLKHLLRQYTADEDMLTI